MKLKQLTSYLLKTMFRITAFFYGIVLLFTILVVALVSILGEDGTIGSRGAASIFLFVLGIVMVYSCVRTGFTFSISRRTVVLSLLIAGLVVAVTIGIVETLLAWFIPSLFSGSPSLIQGYHEPLFSQLATGTDAFLGFLGVFCQNITYMMLALATGYFISGFYYRAKKTLAIIVSIGVPILLVIGLPSAFYVMPVAVQTFIADLFIALFNFIESTPFNSALVALIGSALFFLFMWLFIRRAPVEDK